MHCRCISKSVLQPGDRIEAMLVAEMVSVHVMVMRCAENLATSDDPARQDSTARALSRLAHPDRRPDPLPQPRRTCRDGAERVGRRRRECDRGERDAACECDCAGEKATA